MSIASPQNRDELKSYIKTKLGAPVLQINVSDEQMDLAINDAFQYFYERAHFDSMERTYLSVKISDSLLKFFETGEIESVTQSNTQPIYGDGMAQTLTLVSPGTGYPATTTNDGDMIATETTGGTGSGLTVTPGSARTTTGGITTVDIYNAGSGYTVGDQITLSGGNGDCVFEVTAIKTESPLHGTEDFKTQNNYLILPDGVTGVSRILKPRNSAAWGLGGFGVPFAGGMMMTGMMGTGGMYGINFDLTSYYTMQQFLATADWLLFPQLSYNFNQRSHRLHIATDNFNGLKKDDYLVMECDTKADPDLYPDVFNDMFLKRLSVAYVQLAWGRVLTKYQQVQLPGGLTMNGDQIYNDAKTEIAEITERFAMDYAAPPLDFIG
ncbi:neck protein [Synechococcus phage S-N03]|uniref:Neck protein n=1 Tax=Synechococcus phage S-N03 TaxID=2718943 RepID=A0A6G8R634_9CAUD|nr:head-tail adaptor Ad2 [Synechococcus phage S-N03]QIN96869.1 neck protein [Synechococcus phage S-N03]